MAMSNHVVGGINFVAVLLSIPIIAAGIWLSTKTDNTCVALIQWPVIALGIVTLVVALAGFVGAFWRLHWLLLFYLAAMLVLIMLLLALVCFVFAVSFRGHGHLAPGRFYLEYRLDDYSTWMRHAVAGSSKWPSVKSCLSSTTVCSNLNQTYGTAQQFFMAHINPMQSGCCKPPTKCGYTFINPTFWISPIDPTADRDCVLWSNDQAELCYNCDSCKAGVIANLKKEWKRADLVILIALVLLIFVYFMGCLAYRNAKTEDLFRKYKQGYI